MDNPEFFKEIPVGVYHVRGLPPCTVHGCTAHAVSVLEVSACSADDMMDRDYDGIVLALCREHQLAYAAQMRKLLDSWEG